MFERRPGAVFLPPDGIGQAAGMQRLEARPANATPYEYRRVSGPYRVAVGATAARTMTLVPTGVRL
jgi:hypothetical protein